MSELTKEYVEDYELNYGCGNEDWELVSEELIDYSEGSTTTQYVYKNKEDGELWAFNHEANSWAEYNELHDTYRVEARQVTTTKYFRIK